MTVKPREWARKKIPKVKRRRLIEFYVKHRYWYNQGNNAGNFFDDLVPIEKVTIVFAGANYIYQLIKGGEWKGPLLLAGGGAVILFARATWKWGIGWFWHNNDGYNVETEWNKGKVPPQRVEIINIDELADAVAHRLAPADPFNRLLEQEENKPCEES